ncbi:hypothetical protein BCEP4_1340014 [Burkholderia cepacia]|nr:hypothetical protein BCEP4_1340014 [Burkholderia cepacia]
MPLASSTSNRKVSDNPSCRVNSTTSNDSSPTAKVKRRSDWIAIVGLLAECHAATIDYCEIDVYWTNPKIECLAILFQGFRMKRYLEFTFEPGAPGSHPRIRAR